VSYCTDAHAGAGLELEITETTIIKDLQYTIATLQEIRELGVAIAIDDFGTGFCSLKYLAKLPLDTLKIDRFVRGRYGLRSTWTGAGVDHYQSRSSA
jgi:EAL domain-containing protein (putative c-di-GMP-specific phosphodiesterase class I)